MMKKKKYITPENEQFKVENSSPLADSNHLGNGTDEDAGVKADYGFDGEDIWSKDE